ncbi:methyltransferase domain-containing protein [Rhodocytophaga aerolata]|uniref:Methyltransferase domain-containing protein n=2 Tax=Rhodocytophaga aerolata TaxID=455078 RepID=A0ABT8RFY7_9BACT|nr:class I SAM-dependent methyltransferase [Rhodocytophaga aerolata]MDO1451022.1 methyltransferase domain-containing protein [Rhodocytophaga aerolata]
MNLFKKVILKFILTNQASSVGRNNEENRHKWIEKVLQNIPDGNRILDAGAGEQPFKKFCTHLSYVSQDFSQYNPNNSGVGIQKETWTYGNIDIVSDIINIPEPDSSFDAVLCTEVIEHVPDPVKAICELSRLLKRKGLLIITAPFCSITHFAPYHYSTGFNRFFYEKHLSDLDFDIIEIESNGNFFEYLAQELKFLPGVASKYAKVKLNYEEKIYINSLMLMLDKLSKADTNSSELLCYGYHVLARKR